MAIKVVDASALGAFLFGEPEGGAIAERLTEAALVAPALMPFEVANVCLSKTRRHPEDRESLFEAFGLLARMAIDIVEADHADALRLAHRTGLTAYDASYLWLARKLGAELVTLDKRLEAAATEIR